ncbi:MAG: hypothetical protein NVV73_02580 [Cellvibrionaceae bacterium]|nr:hypothetical protein [Cellvibrionaceae bacterium]
MTDVSNSSHPSRSALRPRLLLIELDYHAEVLTCLCPILAERFELVLWTTDKIWRKTSLPAELFVELLIMPKKYPVERFWRSHEHALLSVDFVYFNTLEKHFGFFAGRKFTCPTVMRIHNTNASLFPFASIDWSLRNACKFAAYMLWYVLLKRMWHHRARLYRNMSLLMLPSEGVVARVRDDAQARGFHNISDYSIPFSCLGDAQPAVRGDRIVFAVTGSVDARRKDYDVLFDALSALKQSRPEWRMEMIFLGWAKQERAQTILERFCSLADEQFQVTSFRDYVSEQTFAEQMARVHFLIAPMKLAASHKIHQEFYGQTKISGLENDVVRYRKPVIVPQDYSLPQDLNRIALTYSDGRSLCDAMITMIDADRWQVLTNRFEELHNYKRSVIAANFYDLWQKLEQQKMTYAQPLVALGGRL